MLVLNTTSPNVSPAAPNARPAYTVPSSRASFAIGWDIDSPREAANGFLQQPVIHQRLSRLRLARGVERDHRQAHLAVAAAEQLHRALQRNRVRRHAEH